MKISSSQWGRDKRTLELKTPTGTKVAGFNLIIRQTDEDGVASQVKLLRVHGVANYGKKKIQFRTVHELQTFVIPKVRPNVRLSYKFASDVSAFSTFLFEFISSYGGPSFIPCPSKIILYKECTYKVLS